MKKKILISIIVMLILFLIIKFYHLCILINIHKKIDTFVSKTNREYCVELLKSNTQTRKEKIFFNNNIIKFIIIENEDVIYIEWKNFNDNNYYAINNLNKELLSKKFFSLEDKNTLYDLPNLFKNNHMLKYLFKIYYIIPTTYNEIKCFKIVTASEKIIIDANTFLPIRLVKRNYNSTENLEECVEYNYKFETGTVTDEDIALPDFSEYKIIE